MPDTSIQQTQMETFDTLHRIRAIALQELGGGYPATLPLGLNHLHEIVKLCDAVLDKCPVGGWR